VIGWNNAIVTLRWVEENTAEFPVAGYENSRFLLGKFEDDFIQ